ncbi:MAG: hypothetical protein D6675_10175 [Gemmatimonadetes bacterium]|nr:MAG: hypothetical protein D6675_10175 [Gemmatimonadota bacterium]
MTTRFSEVRVDPVPWLLENAGPVIRYRTLVDILEKPLDDPEVQKARQAILKTKHAKEVLDNIGDDGSWFGRLVEGSSHNGACTETMFPRMLELGFLPGDEVVERAATFQWHLLEQGMEADTKEFNHHDQQTYAYKHITFLPASYLARIGYQDDPRVTEVFDKLHAGLVEFFENDLQHNLWERKKNVLLIKEDSLWLHDSFILPDLYYLETFAYHPTLKTTPKWKPIFKKCMEWWLEGGRPQGLGSFVWERTNIVHGNNVNFHTLEVAQSYQMTRHYLIKMEQALRTGFAAEFDYFQTEILKLAALQHPEGFWELNGMTNSPQQLEYQYIPLEDKWKGSAREVDVTFRVVQILKHFERSITA